MYVVWWNPLAVRDSAGETPSRTRMTDFVLELKNVAKRYESPSPADATTSGVDALRGVSLTVARGELVAVVGPSGSGKSTLLHMMGALDRATRGEVRIHDQDLAKLDDASITRLRRDRIGFVFQFFNLMPTMTALENVMLPRLLAGARPSSLRSRAEAQLAAVGLGLRMAHKPDQLSGGEMQRVAIARALVSDPPLVLADEPTGNLDTKAGEEVLALLLGATTATRTVVIVTHDPRIAARCTRVVAIRDGAIESDGAP